MKGRLFPIRAECVACGWGTNPATFAEGWPLRTGREAERALLAHTCEETRRS